ncbi:MAG: hypothetical protein ACOYKZ_07380, partial [Chlamydiia bacterium]
MARLLLIISPHDLDRQRLVQSAVQRAKEESKWPVLWLQELPEPDLFAGPEIWVWQQAELLPDPAPLLERCQGRVIGAAARLHDQSPWRRGEVVDLTQEKPWDREGRLARSLSEQAHQLGKVLPADLAVALIRRLGPEHPALEQELAKICLYAGQRHQIQEADLFAVTEVAHQETGWQLGEAVLAHDLGRALQLADHLLVAHDQPMGNLLGQLRYQMEQGLALLQLQKESFSKIYPHLKGKRLEQLQQCVRRLGNTRLEGMLLKVIEAEEES